MSVPMITALKAPETFVNFPANFIKVVIDIMVYTFSTDMNAFIDIIARLKSTLRECYEAIDLANYVHFLEVLAKRMKTLDKRWFNNIASVKKIIYTTLELVKDNKLPGTFDTSTTTMVLDDPSWLHTLLK